MAKTQTYEPQQKLTAVASANLTAHRFVGFDGGVGGSNEKSFGVSESDWTSGETATIVRSGTMLVELGSTVSTVGQALKSDANGKAVSATLVSASVPSGSTTVLSDAAQPDMDLLGGQLPEFINAFALETGTSGEIIKVALV